MFLKAAHHDLAPFWIKAGTIFGAALLLLMVSLFFAPRFMGIGPGLIGLIGLLSLFFFARDHIVWPRAALFWSLAFIALSGLSSLWAVDPAFALERTGKIAFIALSGVSLLSVMMTLQKQKVPLLLSRWAPGIIALMALALLAELLLGVPFYKLTHDIKDYHQNINYVLNRSTIGLLLLVLPVCALSYKRAQGIKNGKLILILSLLFLILMMTSSQSAQLAAIIGAGVFVLFPYKRRWAWHSLAAAIVLLIFAAPWLGIALFKHMLPLAEGSSWLASGAAPQRMEIWNFISHYILEHFWIGSGVEATRFITFDVAGQLYYPSDTVLHPHNFALQLWMEFGVLGAFTGSAFCVYMLHIIRTKLDAGGARIALPVFVAWLSVSATGYGLWQSWWLGLGFFTMAITLQAISRLYGPQNDA